MSTAYVIDASVAVKWFIPEEYSANADTLLIDGNDLHVPDLLYAQVGNILWKHVNRKELNAETAQEIAYAMADLPLRVHPCKALLDHALELAIKLSRSAYDSFYLALAIALNCQLVTADQRLLNSLKQTPFSSQLLSVRDVS